MQQASRSGKHSELDEKKTGNGGGGQETEKSGLNLLQGRGRSRGIRKKEGGGKKGRKRAGESKLFPLRGSAKSSALGGWLSRGEPKMGRDGVREKSFASGVMGFKKEQQQRGWEHKTPTCERNSGTLAKERVQ